MQGHGLPRPCAARRRATAPGIIPIVTVCGSIYQIVGRIHIQLREQGILEALRHGESTRHPYVRDGLEGIVIYRRDELPEELLKPWHRVLGNISQVFLGC